MLQILAAIKFKTENKFWYSGVLNTRWGLNNWGGSEKFKIINKPGGGVLLNGGGGGGVGKYN